MRKQGCEIYLNFLMRMLMIACLVLSVEVSYCQTKEELEEQKEIFSMVQERMSHYDASKNVSWSSLRDK